MEKKCLTVNKLVTVKIVNSSFIFIVALTFFSCFGGGKETPMGEPRDTEEIVGFWRHPQAVLDIYPAEIHYESRFGTGSKSLDVPIMAYDGERLLAGIPFMKTTFVIDSLPFVGEDGVRRIIIDGHEYVEISPPNTRSASDEIDQVEYEQAFLVTLNSMFDAIENQDKEKMASLFVPGTIAPENIDWAAFDQIKELTGKSYMNFNSGILSENGQLLTSVEYPDLDQKFTLQFQKIEEEWKVTEFRFDSINQ